MKSTPQEQLYFNLTANALLQVTFNNTNGVILVARVLVKSTPQNQLYFNLISNALLQVNVNNTNGVISVARVLVKLNLW